MVSGSGDSLDEHAAARERAVLAREAELAARQDQLAEQERVVAARVASLEEALDLARAQLIAANHRADRPEESARNREADGERHRLRAESFEREAREVRDKLDAAVAAHRAEREKLDERYAANEARWLLEVDRVRQALKEAAQDRQRQAKEFCVQSRSLKAERDALKRKLQVARSETRDALKRNGQFEKRVTTAESAKIVRQKNPRRDAPQRHPAGAGQVRNDRYEPHEWIRRDLGHAGMDNAALDSGNALCSCALGARPLA